MASDTLTAQYTGNGKIDFAPAFSPDAGPSVHDAMIDVAESTLAERGVANLDQLSPSDRENLVARVAGQSVVNLTFN